MNTRECKCGCGKFFEPKRISQSYASPKCCRKHNHRKEREQYKSMFKYNNFVRADRKLIYLEEIGHD